ncbi:MAG: HK97 family phage prohead protease [Pseudomonadota bacterium]
MSDLPDAPLLVEGYAALFGAPDLSGDVVRGGAFSASLARGQPVAMLLQHKQGAIAGRWTRVREDGRGLYVRGLVENRGAKRLIAHGLDGLSIGFRPRFWKPGNRGRDLVAIDLVEISLVASPMQPLARFNALPGRQFAA